MDDTFERFIKTYNSLSGHQQIIVFRTIQCLVKHTKKPKVHERFKSEVFEMISDRRKELGMSRKELERKLARIQDENGFQFSKKTFESFMSRKSTDSEMFELACEILGISREERNEIQMQITIADQTDISWYFEAISKEGRKAMLCLVWNLWIEENAPDQFDEDFSYYD